MWIVIGIAIMTAFIATMINIASKQEKETQKQEKEKRNSESERWRLESEKRSLEIFEDKYRILNIEIAGLYYRSSETHKLARGLIPGTFLSLELEPDNEYDEYAVKIMCKDVHIGYIPTAYTKLISSKLQEGGEYTVEVMSNDRSEKPHVWVKLYPTAHDYPQEVSMDTSAEKQLTRDILDGINVDLYIKYIARMLLYSEYGYDSRDNVLPSNLNERDPLFEDAARLIVIHQQGLTSLIQREFSIGYNRAGRLMDQLEAAEIIGKALGSQPRVVYIKNEQSLAQRISSIKNNSNIDEILNAVEERYYDKIQNIKEYMLKCIEQEKELERLQKIDDEKEAIRNKILEKERKRQLERDIRQELIDEGLVSPD